MGTVAIYAPGATGSSLSLIKSLDVWSKMTAYFVLDFIFVPSAVAASPAAGVVVAARRASFPAPSSSSGGETRTGIPMVPLIGPNMVMLFFVAPVVGSTGATLNPPPATGRITTWSPVM